MYAWIQRHKAIIFFVCMAVYPLLFVFQGFDMTDNGYMAASFNLFFRDPESIGFTFAYWLTCFFGALWHTLFDGLIGLRIMGAVVTWITIGLYYRLLTRRAGLDKTRVAAALCLVLILTYNYCRMFDYNRLTACLYAIAVYILYIGILDGGRKRVLCFFVGAFVLAVAFFARIANLCGLLILAAALLGLRLYRGPNWRCVGAAAAGLGVGVAAVLLCMQVLGHGAYFFNAVRLYMAIGAGAESTHSVGGLLAQWLNNNLFALLYGAALAVGGAVVFVIDWLMRKKSAPKGVYMTLSVLLLAAFWGAVVLAEYRLSAMDVNRMLVRGLNGVFYMAALWLCFAVKNKKRPKEMLLLYGLGLAVLIATPLGSDNGMYNSVFGMWLVGAMAMEGLLATRKPFAYLLTVMMIVYGLRYAYGYNFREISPRASLRTPMQNERLRFIYTNENRARLTDAMTDAIGGLTDPGERILIYGSAPMLYYLTDTAPVLGNSWAELYDTGQFIEAFDRYVADANLLPAIVLLHFNTNDDNWPTGTPETYPDYVRTIDARYAYVAAFMAAQNYTQVNDDAWFGVYRAPH